MGKQRSVTHQNLARGLNDLIIRNLDRYNARMIIKDKFGSHAEFARTIGISPSQFCKLMTGQRIFSVAELFAVAETIGVTINDLLKER